MRHRARDKNGAELNTGDMVNVGAEATFMGQYAETGDDDLWVSSSLGSRRLPRAWVTKVDNTPLTYSWRSGTDDLHGNTYWVLDKSTGGCAATVFRGYVKDEPGWIVSSAAMAGDDEETTLFPTAEAAKAAVDKAVRP
jgi:hypothetical protein